MNAATIASLFQYNYAMHRRLWKSIMTLTDAQFTEPIAYSMGSIRNHMVHLTSVDARWLARIQEQTPPERLNLEAFGSAPQLREQWEQVAQDAVAFATGIDEATLQHELTFDMPHRGGTRVNTVGQIMLHMVNHGTDHRAQILPILHRMGAATFEHDYILYLWE